MPEITTDYTTLSLAQVRTGLADVARAAQATFGHLDARQLNWRPDAARWSVAQCFEHLLTTNRLMLQAARDALSGARSAAWWQRLPLLPGLFGRLLIRSQSPAATRKLATSPQARPAASDIAPDIIGRFVEQHLGAMAWVETVDERQAARAILVSPFISVVTYSVLDGCRLVVAHDWRHVEQARRVMQEPAFPGAGAGV